MKVRLGFDHLFVVPSDGCSGGIALLWKDEIPLRPLTASAHHIDVEI